MMQSTKRSWRAVLTILSLGLVFAARLLAADWPQWRGLHRDGISLDTGLLKQWPQSGPGLAWKTNGLGAGYSGVSVANGRIYTMGDGPDASFVYCLSETNGNHLWAAKVGKTGGGSGHPGPRCTPTVSGDAVIALGQFGDLVCLELATGKERWRKSMLADFKGKMMSGWGYSESPLVDAEKVVCTPGGPDGTLIALNRETGAEIWRTKDLKEPAAYSSVVVADIAGRRQYVQLTSASVFAVAPEDGTVLWRAPRRGKTAVIPTPVCYGDYVYVTSGYEVGCNLFKITAAGNRFRAQQVYANGNMVNHHGGVVRVGEYVYGYSDGKGWTCQEFITGKVAWAEKGKLGKGSICYADGHLYLRSENDGRVALIKATPQGYRETGRLHQTGRSELKAWPHPVVANGKLYLRDQDLLLCYDLQH